MSATTSYRCTVLGCSFISDREGKKRKHAYTGELVQPHAQQGREVTTVAHKKMKAFIVLSLSLYAPLHYTTTHTHARLQARTCTP